MKKLFKWFEGIDSWILKLPKKIPAIKGLDLQGEVRGIAMIMKRALLYLPFAIIVALIVWAIYWGVYIGPKPAESNPERQGLIPEIIPTPTAMLSADPWERHEWLSSDDARKLRDAKNVVNLANLRDSGVNYSAAYSIQFTEGSPWEDAKKPYGIEGLSVSGTSLTIKVNGYTYNLNVFQPFFVGNETTVYVVDLQGKLWKANLRDLQLIPIEEVELTIEVAPNEALTLTH